MGGLKQVVAFLAQGLVRQQPGNGGASRVEVGDVETGVNLHDRGGDDIQIGLQLPQFRLNLFGMADVLHADQAEAAAAIVQGRGRGGKETDLLSPTEHGL